MITGHFNDDHEARISIVVRGLEGQSRELEALIDTGYTGFLTLSPSIVELLDLPWIGRSLAVLGDGGTQPFDVHKGIVVWDGKRLAIEVDVAETDPMIGMRLIYGHNLRIEAIEGGTVTLESLLTM